MKAKCTFLISMMLSTLFSCKDSENTNHKNTNHVNNEHHWSYTGETSPEHWIEIEKKSDCDGKHQSPINIIHRNVDSTQTKNDLNILYIPQHLLVKLKTMVILSNLILSLEILLAIKMKLIT